MPDGIPEGITRGDIEQAIADFDTGAAHEFAPSTGYDISFSGKRYPPKAIVGLAARRLAGRTLGPDDFKGGEGSKCFRILRELGIDVVPKSHGQAYLLTWNSTKWTWPNFDEVASLSGTGKLISQHWSTGNTKQIEPGSRVFLIRQATERGIIASGYTTAPVRTGAHWDGSGRQRLLVDVEFDKVLSIDDVLPVDVLLRQVPSVAWNHLLASGTSASAEAATQLEAIWNAHLRLIAPVQLADEVDAVTTFREGATKQVTVNAYERNPKARLACIRYFGTQCSVCCFDFAKVYGQIGEGFIHVHHLKDLATIRDEYEVAPLKDLRPVCPNCHAMLHAEKPAMSIESLRTIIESNRPPE